MSKPRFSMRIRVDTLAHAKTIRDSILAQLSGKDIFQQHSLDAFQDTNGSIIGIAEWRFNNSEDRDAIRDWIKDQIQNNAQVKVWVIEAQLIWHNCTHDDADVKDCHTQQYQEWNK